jgi:aldehyde:ferredoxin oxidoreductase
MGNGYWQRLLRVDLTQRTTAVEQIAENDLRRLIGGAGMAAEILRRELPGKMPPFDPANRLIFATGPFQGPAVPGGAKFSVVSVSPLTKTFGDSAAGAGWGPALKDAGYDLLVIQGAADAPVYLSIHDDQVEIRDAAGLWGMDTVDVVDAIRRELGDAKASVAAIGPAGERRVAVACIAVDKHSYAGRCGLGAVMGSKNLKAVAVRGTRHVPVAAADISKQLIARFQTEISQAVKKNDFRDHGTPMLCEKAEALGDMPIKYWDGDVWPEGARELGAPNYTRVLNAKPLPCKYCPIGCHRRISITEPKEYALEGPGPEYETVGMMGTNLLIDDCKAVAKANDIANRLGVDTISTGAMIGFAMQCYERGWIGPGDTGGLELKWGDPRVLIELTRQIGLREGFGEFLADGTLAAAEKIGPQAVETVVHCKGLDLPAHDARSCFSLATTYATGTRGACHFRGPSEDVEMGGLFMPEVGINPGTVEFFGTANQALVTAKCQDMSALCGSLVMCLFMLDGGEWPLTAMKDMFNAITGWDFSVDDLMLAGERIFTLQRLLNVRDGYDGRTDVLPKKMLQPAQIGFRAGKAPPFAAMLQDYYRFRGWKEDGEPRAETLERLGLNA